MAKRMTKERKEKLRKIWKKRSGPKITFKAFLRTIRHTKSHSRKKSKRRGGHVPISILKKRLIKLSRVIESRTS